MTVGKTSRFVISREDDTDWKVLIQVTGAGVAE